MKQLFYTAIVAAFISISCVHFGDRVNGNGNVKSVERAVAKTSGIRLLGGMDVFIDEGPSMVKIQADENIIPYILTEVNNGWLEIKTKNHVGLHPSSPIKIYVTTPGFNGLEVTGSGNIVGKKKFSAPTNMFFKITGSGDIRVDVNSPKVHAEITGSGTLHITGETRDVDVHVTGSGDFDGPNLKAENANVKIAGSGDVNLFADMNLRASIMGSGDVKYRGNANVEKNIAGSGSVTKVP